MLRLILSSMMLVILSTDAFSETEEIDASEETTETEETEEIDASEETTETEEIEEIDPADPAEDDTYRDDASDHGYGISRGEGIIGFIYEKYYEEGILVGDLKVKYREQDLEATTACACWRIRPNNLYGEIGASLTMHNLLWESGALAEQYLETAIRLGLGFQYDYERFSLDIKFASVDFGDFEIHRKSYGDPVSNGRDRKVKYSDYFVISLLYFPVH